MDKDILNLLKERNIFQYACEFMQMLYSVLCKEDALEKVEILDKICVY